MKSTAHRAGVASRPGGDSASASLRASVTMNGGSMAGVYTVAPPHQLMEVADGGGWWVWWTGSDGGGRFRSSPGRTVKATMVVVGIKLALTLLI
ncbi:hypothetical protein NL676_039657 [Syzygium grande]|nr:hypothetical protein NL676_039657 [Syzygium grande]